MTPLSLLRPGRTLAVGAAFLMIASFAAACGGGEDGEGSDGSVDVVRVGTLNSNSDAPFFIADAKGYFAEQGIEVEFVPFKSSTEMIAPLGQGQIDVGGGGLAAALFNAVGRGVNLKIVADKGTNRTGYSYPIVVRSDLLDSGEVQAIGDLKGRTFAVSAPGTVLDYLLAKGLAGSGISFDDVEVNGPLGFPDQVNAFANKAIDASILIEPFATEAEKQGVARRLAFSEEWANNETLAVTLYGGPFMEERRDVAVRFMVAYIQGIRFYLDALEDGKLAGPNAAEVIDILTEYTPVKDPQLYQEITPTANDPDGRVNVEAVNEMLEFWGQQGLLEGPEVTAEQAVDMSFIDEALERMPQG
ncbi:MAG TPA: ABC transporter substrate-binding protein [Actinopolymorphaceae bacterium]